MKATVPVPYRIARGLLRVALGFFFTRIVRFHRERVPATGPVLFTSNHPNALTDPFLIGASVQRKVNFVATVQIFQAGPARWILPHLGVIPVNRAQDDPRAMRSVFETFEACFHVLEHGEAIGIFPEGLTHDDPQLKTVKTGAARMALELEHRHGGTLGLKIVPVGLNFSSKETYRSDVLVNFGKPIRAAGFLRGYPEEKHRCIRVLNEKIERRLKGLILHVPHLERVRVVRAVRRLYQPRRWVKGSLVRQPAPRQVADLHLTRRIARAVDFAFEHHPEQAARFVRNLDRYERGLNRLHLSDELLGQLPDKKHRFWQNLGWALLGVVGAPVAAYGWLHRLVPILVIRRSIRQYGGPNQRRSTVSSAAIVAGIVTFGLFYVLCAAVFYAIFGWPATLFYALSLPVASLAAHYYTRELKRFAASVRASWVRLRAPLATRNLLALRAELIAEIEAEQRAIGRQLAPEKRTA